MKALIWTITTAVFGLSSITYGSNPIYLKAAIELKDTALQMEDAQLISVKGALKIHADTNYYDKGERDAKKFHKKRASGNFGLGCLGILGFMGVALSPAKGPDVNDIKDQTLHQNPEYLRGYKHKAKNKNVGNAALGLTTHVIVGMTLLVLYGAR